MKDTKQIIIDAAKKSAKGHFDCGARDMENLPMEGDFDALAEDLGRDPNEYEQSLFENEMDLALDELVWA